MALGDLLTLNSQGSGAPGGPTPALGAPTPGAMQAPARDLNKEWTDFLSVPANRSAMIQMGVNLLQPIGLGQSTVGHIGQAIGAGAEAYDRARTQEEAAASSQRELDIRQQQADADTARAQQSGLTAAALLANSRAQANSFEAFLMKAAQSIVDQDLTFQTTLDQALQQIMGDPARLQQLKTQWETIRRAGGGGQALDQTVPNPGGATAPPQAAIDLLRRDPSLATQFDQKYGPGSAQRYLGQ